MTETSENRPLRWGIFGAGKISEDFCTALLALPKEKHILQHVAARDLYRAEIFASCFNVANFSADYKEVAEDKDVDIIYIGTINPTHKDLSILALNYGKAVLCEKPVTMSSHELLEVLEVAEKNKVFFMEAMWTRLFPLYQDILSKINSNYYGEPCALFATFGIQNLFKLDRIWNPSLGGSVTADIGVYLLTIADMFFNKYKVKEFKACGHVDEEFGCDRSVGFTITYEGNKIVQLMANGDCALRNEVELICSNGKVRVESPFWCPEKYVEEISGVVKEFDFKLPALITNFSNSSGLRFEAEHVRDCLLKKLVESPIVTHETSKRIMGYLDETRKQLGMQL